jgi:hypothetical protein
MSHRIVILMLSAGFLQACRRGHARHTAYTTLDSMRMQQCLDRRDDPYCPTGRERYDRYEAKQPPSPDQ